MAVYSIVLLQPILYNLWKWQHPVKNFFWGIFTVTLAAQIGVAPLSIFYFHQLPGLFLLGNMILLPILPLIIGASLMLIIFLLSGIPTIYLVESLNFVLNHIIKLITKISSYDEFIYKNLYIEAYELILLYVIIFSVALYLKPLLSRSRKEQIRNWRANWMLHISLAGLILLTGTSILKGAEDKDSQVLLLHQARGNAVSIYNRNQVQLLLDLSQMDSTRRSISLTRLKNIAPHRNKQITTNTLENHLKFDDLNLIRIDSTGVWEKGIENAIILLSQSPKINLERLITDLKPRAIISDGSNYRSSVELWKETSEKLNVPFYNTYDAGAIDLLDL